MLPGAALVIHDPCPLALNIFFVLATVNLTETNGAWVYGDGPVDKVLAGHI